VDPQRFVLVGEHSSPEDFENYTLVQLLKRKPLELKAVEEGTSIEEPFTFRTRETHHDPNFWVNVTDDAGRWIRIDAVDGKVFFDQYPA